MTDCSSSVSWAENSAMASVLFNELSLRVSCDRTSFKDEKITAIFSIILVVWVESSIFKLFSMSIRSSSSLDIAEFVSSIALAS
ncbi:hypothetical protein D3C81_1189030 [compost metagenome]